MEAMHTDRQDITQHFSKEKKPYSGPRPAQGFGIADRPPAPSWRESLGRFLASQLTMRPAIRWGLSWSGAPVDELSKVINGLCEKGILVLQRHQPPGHAAFWTLSRGLNFHPEILEKEVINA